uniref:Uncharacterized protein n=1 Tax=Timema bartmani TaxID=61472 RepID=A0A7R9I0I6_9NEOP|nr:unnamed protein product [Timema bartmani]
MLKCVTFNKNQHKTGAMFYLSLHLCVKIKERRFLIGNVTLLQHLKEKEIVWLTTLAPVDFVSARLHSTNTSRHYPYQTDYRGVMVRPSRVDFTYTVFPLPSSNQPPTTTIKNP